MSGESLLFLMMLRLQSSMTASYSLQHTPNATPAKKNDGLLNQSIVDEALRYGRPDAIAWYERPIIKKTRQAAAGQWSEVFGANTLPKSYLKNFGLSGIPIEYIPHHESHAAAGVYTSPFDDAVVIVADAIGEWSTFSIGEWRNGETSFGYESVYPHSLGLLYTAFTHRCGLKPNEEEFILMGMSAFGEPKYRDEILRDHVEWSTDPFSFRLTENLHKGMPEYLPGARNEDLAASIQVVCEDILLSAVQWAGKNYTSKNLVLMGGVALNCVANTRIAGWWKAHTGSDRGLWIMPNPGDAGSCIGAAASLIKSKVSWKGPYLGTDVERPDQYDDVMKALLRGDVIALAHGRAEFGPRALGNRSILTDPRGALTKDKVNEIKRREKFRPFAPAILEEDAHEYFDLQTHRSPYMQYAVRCKKRDEFPAIVHVDGSSRVQTVNEQDNPHFYAILKEFKSKTGCPILLNTSMNIKGEPLVNTWEDAVRFTQTTGITSYS